MAQHEHNVTALEASRPGRCGRSRSRDSPCCSSATTIACTRWGRPARMPAARSPRACAAATVWSALAQGDVFLTHRRGTRASRHGSAPAPPCAHREWPRARDARRGHATEAASGDTALCHRGRRRAALSPPKRCGGGFGGRVLMLDRDNRVPYDRTIPIRALGREGRREIAAAEPVLLSRPADPDHRRREHGRARRAASPCTDGGCSPARLCSPAAAQTKVVSGPRRNVLLAAPVASNPRAGEHRPP